MNTGRVGVKRLGAMDSTQELLRQHVGGLRVDPVFFRFVEEELLPEIEFEAATFWRGLESIVDELTPLNRQLLEIRDDLQAQIDHWHEDRVGQSWERSEYIDFLFRIGYLREEGEAFTI